MNYLTVEQLEDIIQSQLCVYGNLAVFIKIKNNNGEFTISIHANDRLILDSTSQSNFSLETIAKRLKNLEPDTVIEYSHDSTTNLVFELGFMAEGRFIQVTCLGELKPTIETITYERYGRIQYHPDYHGKQDQSW
ncbi:hypothetical protein MACH09_46740 [Vibrio sp. MACH09]|uniref:hypothetical protein n=1 Tax=Vibrio sp. MACH09 TaxID=3025122 RepID=UPI00278E7402|nr:hypothetical protein [Vibrio sp. MACH09]GLO64166.1 hypothetical protein MACH09_46740 [Vibrio sp. MACH09]